MYKINKNSFRPSQVIAHLPELQSWMGRGEDAAARYTESLHTFREWLQTGQGAPKWPAATRQQEPGRLAPRKGSSRLLLKAPLAVCDGLSLGSVHAVETAVGEGTSPRPKGFKERLLKEATA